MECVAASYEGGASLGRLEEVAIARCRIAPLVARLLQYRTSLGCRAVHDIKERSIVRCGELVSGTRQFELPYSIDVIVANPIHRKEFFLT